MFKRADCFSRGPVLNFQHLYQQLTTVCNCGSLRYKALFFSVMTHMQQNTHPQKIKWRMNPLNLVSSESVHKCNLEICTNLEHGVEVPGQKNGKYLVGLQTWE